MEHPHVAFLHNSQRKGVCLVKATLAYTSDNPIHFRNMWFVSGLAQTYGFVLCLLGYICGKRLSVQAEKYCSNHFWLPRYLILTGSCSHCWISGSLSCCGHWPCWNERGWTCGECLSCCQFLGLSFEEELAECASALYQEYNGKASASVLKLCLVQ